MTCDCGDDEDADAPGDDGHQAEISTVVGGKDGFISVELRGGDGETSDEMVSTLRDVLAESAGYLDRDGDDAPDKGVR